MSKAPPLSFDSTDSKFASPLTRFNPMPLVLRVPFLRLLSCFMSNTLLKGSSLNKQFTNVSKIFRSGERGLRRTIRVNLDNVTTFHKQVGDVLALFFCLPLLIPLFLMTHILHMTLIFGKNNLKRVTFTFTSLLLG